jgi:hypothetical protein
MDDISLVIEFVTPTSFLLERDRASELPIVRNGPPGSFVLFPDGLRVSLPTDQIVFADDVAGCVRVGFGGMRYVGCEDGQLVFVRFRELHPEEHLSPARSHTMRLDARWVAAITAPGSHEVFVGRKPHD